MTAVRFCQCLTDENAFKLGESRFVKVAEVQNLPRPGGSNLKMQDRQFRFVL